MGLSETCVFHVDVPFFKLIPGKRKVERQLQRLLQCPGA
jgi:hypothetical protein